jgi:hypothetical protein
VRFEELTVLVAEGSGILGCPEKSYKKFSKTSQSLNIKVVYSFITSECFNPTAVYNILEDQNLYLL